jgi:hypothetical protein
MPSAKVCFVCRVSAVFRVLLLGALLCAGRLLSGLPRGWHCQNLMTLCGFDLYADHEYELQVSRLMTIDFPARAIF